LTKRKIFHATLVGTSRPARMRVRKRQFTYFGKVGTLGFPGGVTGAVRST
jgi:hypothetical protein